MKFFGLLLLVLFLLSQLASCILAMPVPIGESHGGSGGHPGGGGSGHPGGSSHPAGHSGNAGNSHPGGGTPHPSNSHNNQHTVTGSTNHDPNKANHDPNKANHDPNKANHDPNKQKAEVIAVTRQQDKLLSQIAAAHQYAKDTKQQHIDNLPKYEAKPQEHAKPEWQKNLGIAAKVVGHVVGMVAPIGKAPGLSALAKGAYEVAKKAGAPSVTDIAKSAAEKAWAKYSNKNK